MRSRALLHLPLPATRRCTSAMRTAPPPPPRRAGSGSLRERRATRGADCTCVPGSRARQFGSEVRCSRRGRGQRRVGQLDQWHDISLSLSLSPPSLSPSLSLILARCITSSAQPSLSRRTRGQGGHVRRAARKVGEARPPRTTRCSAGHVARATMVSQDRAACWRSIQASMLPPSILGPT